MKFHGTNSMTLSEDAIKVGHEVPGARLIVNQRLNQEARQLRSRGLIKATTDRERAAMQKAKKPVRIYRLTKAGELLCALLDEAGITLDNTVTLTIARQMAYWKGSDLTAHSTVEGKSEAHL